MAGLEGGRATTGDVPRSARQGVTDGELGGDLGDGGKPVALEASAEERDTRGFISMMTMRPSFGVDAELDVGTAGLDADLRSTAMEALRMIWYPCRSASGLARP